MILNIKIREKTLLNLTQSICWENWLDEDGNTFTIGDVFMNRLQWLLESNELTEEATDTIQDLIKLVCPLLDEIDKNVFDKNGDYIEGVCMK